MCGIAGIIGSLGGSLSMQQMLQEQSHRGPDNTAVWQQEAVWLGHNRLSIIDLSDAANQPMQDASGRYSMVFNGEIYNYKELRKRYLADEAMHSQGDSEVLLALYVKYGEPILNELIGMFAFAIWDTKAKLLFAARDRFGVKPFYYTVENKALVFASELRTLWKYGIEKQPRVDVWSAYFSTGSYGIPSDTFWENVFQLPGGYLLRYSAERGITIQQWYSFENAVAKQTIYDDKALLHNAYLELLQDAVALRFRADVPVGFSLSGGLDSSLLLASIHHLFPDNQSIEAFSFCTGHALYDEWRWAEKLASRTNKPLHAVYLNSNEVPSLAKQMSDLQAEPYGAIPTLAYHKVFAAAKAKGFKVMLDGQGMDEAWAGYDYYFSGKDHLVQGSVSSPVNKAALLPAFANLQQPLAYDKPFASHLQNLQYRDLFITKLPRALRFNDRASMLASVELREPFLDHRLVELAFAQEDHMKLRNNQPKWMLRKIAGEWLGHDLAFAPKRPVQTPQREWLRNELKDWANDHISWLATTGNPGWFNGKQMLQEWAEFVEGRGDNSFYVWQWINAAMLFQNS